LGRLGRILKQSLAIYQYLFYTQIKQFRIHFQQRQHPNLGILRLKGQIPSTKLQINLKFQYPMTETFKYEALFGFSDFGHWDLFDIWDLIFGISIHQRNYNKTNPFRGQSIPISLGQDFCYDL